MASVTSNSEQREVGSPVRTSQVHQPSPFPAMSAPNRPVDEDFWMVRFSTAVDLQRNQSRSPRRPGPGPSAAQVIIVAGSDTSDQNGEEDSQAMLTMGPPPQHHFAEVFSPPRMVPFMALRGLLATTSMDIITGYDFTASADRDAALRFSTKRGPSC